MHSFVNVDCVVPSDRKQYFLPINYLNCGVLPFTISMEAVTVYVTDPTDGSAPTLIHVSKSALID